MSNQQEPANFDSSLVELRAVRNLEAIASSMETFLLAQIEKIESSLEKCDEAFTQHELLQQRFIEFENEKAAWDATQKLESQRLYEIGEKLIAGWEQLEKERFELHVGELSPDPQQHGQEQAGG